MTVREDAGTTEGGALGRVSGAGSGGPGCVDSRLRENDGGEGMTFGCFAL